MPYRYAWLFIIALIAATAFAFWRSYFSTFVEAPVGFHVHGLTASLWILLLLAQSLTPHLGQFALHRTLGRAVFIAVPLFAAGSMGVVHSMAAGMDDGDSLYVLWGAPLGFIDILAFGAVLYAAGMALRHRRNVQLHAGYMLSTALPLVSPVLGRVINRTIPGFVIHGPQDFPIFGWGVQFANLIAAGIALWLWRRDRRIGRPWAVALIVITIQIVGFETIGASDAWHTVFAAVGMQPLAALMAFGLAASAATMFVGWTMPIRPRSPQPKAA